MSHQATILAPALCSIPRYVGLLANLNFLGIVPSPLVTISSSLRLSSRRGRARRRPAPSVLPRPSSRRRPTRRSVPRSSSVLRSTFRSTARLSRISSASPVSPRMAMLPTFLLRPSSSSSSVSRVSPRSPPSPARFYSFSVSSRSTTVSSSVSPRLLRR